jgi:hypothetical protein
MAAVFYYQLISDKGVKMGNVVGAHPEQGDGDGDNCLSYIDLMSHDLLNSNQAVLSSLELMLTAGSIGEETRRYIVSAIEQVRTSSRLIDSVRKIARLEQMDPDEFETFSVEGTVRDSIEAAESRNPGKKMAIGLQNLAGPANVKATEVLIDVFVNLISSAAGLEAAGKPAVDVAISRPEAAPGMIDITFMRGGDRKSDSKKGARQGAGRELDIGLLMAEAAVKRFGGQLVIDEMIHRGRAKGGKSTVRLPEVRV